MPSVKNAYGNDNQPPGEWLTFLLACPVSPAERGVRPNAGGPPERS
jgi:hypothetical protein